MRPYIYINVAVTADGKMDTFERRGAIISSPRDKERVDRLRAESDAIMVGGNTLRDEDPKLTVKSAKLRAERERRGLPPHPAKVGIASRADLRLASAFLMAGSARIFLFTTPQTDEAQVAMLRSRGAQVFVHDAPRVDLVAALQTLKEHGIQRLMVEGGGTLISEMLRLGLVDELTVFVAPMIFGGESAPGMVAGPGLARSAAIPLKLVDAEVWEDGGVLLHYKL